MRVADETRDTCAEDNIPGREVTNVQIAANPGMVVSFTLRGEEGRRLRRYARAANQTVSATTAQIVNAFFDNSPAIEQADTEQGGG